MRLIAAIVMLVSALLVVPGWYLGYHSPWVYIAFWLLNTLALLNDWVLFNLFFYSDRLHEAMIRIAVLAFALVVASGMVLGVARLLTPTAYAAFLFGLLSVLVMLNRRELSARRFSATISMPRIHPAVMLATPILILVLCVGVMRPPVEYDSLTYHLFFPARWLQDHRLSIVPTPFGSDGPAYEPSNGELFFLWLMLPFRGDLLARAGQFPFYCLGALTLYGIARRLGSAHAHALYASGLFVLATPIVTQAVGANVDLGFAALFLTAVYFGLTASETGRRSDIILWGISIGLCLGTKYLGLIYAPLLLPFALTRQIRRKAFWALPGIAAFAAPWYVRNWVEAGSPIFPASVTFAGTTIAAGAYAPAVLKTRSWEHLTDPAELPRIVQQAFGADLLLVWLPFALLGMWALVRNRRSVAIAVALIVPLLMVALFWYVNPYNNVYSARYLFAGVGLAMLLAPFAFHVSAKVSLFIHIAFGAAILWLVGMSTRPLVERPFMPLYAALAACVIVLWRAGGRRIATLVASFGGVCVAAFLYAMLTCGGRDCTLLHLSLFTRPTLFAGWDWVDAHVVHSTIAYAGTNIPYRLLGSHFDNHVYYVNIDRHLDWRYHDYARAARKRADYRPPDKPNPRYDRQQGYAVAWMANLRRVDAGYLFVTRISSLNVDEYWHDEAGFPVEAAWAESHPEMFALVYQNPEVKIYSVRYVS